MKANYQSVNTFGGLCEASAQSIVECRLQSAEVVKVLLCEPRVVLEESACDSGEVRYGGKLLVSFLYEDASGKLCRAERLNRVDNYNVRRNSVALRNYGIKVGFCEQIQRISAYIESLSAKLKLPFGFLSRNV